MRGELRSRAKREPGHVRALSKRQLEGPVEAHDRKGQPIIPTLDQLEIRAVRMSIAITAKLFHIEHEINKAYREMARMIRRKLREGRRQGRGFPQWTPSEAGGLITGSYAAELVAVVRLKASNTLRALNDLESIRYEVPMAPDEWVEKILS